MRKVRQTLGFTMAELLIVVAIIGVLSGVSFIAVQNHQRSTALLERDSIAKEIFIAAQNHMTMAESQGYMGVNMIDEPNAHITDNKVYYAAYSGKSNDVLNVLLPFGSIDETVRVGGRYVISYQTNPARILDVFYWTPSGRFGGEIKTDYTDYTDILALAGDGNRNARKKHDPVIGWFGGEQAEVIDYIDIDPPEIEVVNAEKLSVNVKYNAVIPSGSTVELKLFVRGQNAEMAFSLVNTHDRVTYDGSAGCYTVVLDDITHPVDSYNVGFHFADLNLITINEEEENKPVARNGMFIPGEDITVQAVAYSSNKLSNIAYSAEITTNSLFADVEKMTWGDEEKSTALIGNIRHLENLDDHISNLENRISNPDYINSEPENTLGITHAQQTVDLAAPKAEEAADLSWNGFKTAIGSPTMKIYGYTDSEGSKDNTFKPVSPGYALTYDGNGYSIEGIAVDCNGNAGLFGVLITDSSISNLELVDFNIKANKPESGSANAGALAGSMVGTTVTNVLARNSSNAAVCTVTAVDSEGSPAGSAGGLIGSMPSYSSVNKCAAALVVSGGNAGGLIGSSEDGRVTACYSGGHTTDAEYKGTWDADTHTASNFNVTAAADAGGLVGNAGSATITDCYSTCSAAGATAGGLVGEATGDISNSYAVGLVKGDTSSEGAFAGKHESGTLSDNHYFEIINEREDSVKGFICLKPVGNAADDANLKNKVDAIDETAATYDDFSWPGGGNCPWKRAEVYDDQLKTYYGTGSGEARVARYNLRTVGQLEADDDTADCFVATHYGDWPAPEIFVFNTEG